MCEKGINTDQMRLMIAQIDDSLSLSQQWLEQFHHLADHAGLHAASVSAAQASVLLGEARAKLETAINTMAGEPDGKVTIERL